MVKGQTGIELLIMVAMVTLTIFIASLIPTTHVKSKLDQETTFEYKYNKVQHTLLTLFSITHDEKKVSEIIAEKFAINKPSDEEFKNILKPILDKQIETKCYELNVSSRISKKTLLSSGCDPSYWVNSTIVLPYNPNNLVGEIWVGIK